MPDEPATRRELAELRRSVNIQLRRLEATLKDHKREHEADARARVTGRRWLIGTVIALAAVIEAPLLYLVTHLHLAGGGQAPRSRTGRRPSRHTPAQSAPRCCGPRIRTGNFWDMSPSRCRCASPRARA